MRLDRMRSEKFKFIQDSMANHRIEEVSSEYNASIISTHERRNTRNVDDRKHRSSGYNAGQGNAVLEVDEDEESENSRKWPSEI